MPGKKKRPRAPKAATASSSSAPNPALDHEFRNRLHPVWSQNREVQNGCRFCLHECVESLREDEESIMDYRQAFRRLPQGSQDRDLLWIFGGGADELLAPNLEDLPAFPMEHTCPTASSEPSPMEATSQSITDDGNPMAERQEDTSASDSVDAEQPQPTSRPSSPPAATILEAPMESTSSSSSMPPTRV